MRDLLARAAPRRAPLRWPTSILARLRILVVGFVARIPARVETKLLLAFLAMVALLIVLGAVGLGVLRDANRRTDDLIQLQRKIAAYRQVQQDTTSQLYGISSALLLDNDQALTAAMRQLNRFGYDLERLQFIAKDEAELSGQVRQAYDQFVAVVTQAVDLIRAGHLAEARETQLARAGPLADRLERLTNQLVNRAEADMVAGIAASQQSYATSQIVVIAFVCGSVALALLLGYIISWSLIGPVAEIDARLRKVAAGDYAARIDVENRDELGALAANVNRMSAALGARTHELQEALEYQTATAEVLGVISRSPTALGPVLDAICGIAARLCEAEWAVCFQLRDGRYHLAGSSSAKSELVTYYTEHPIPPGRGSLVGRVALDRCTTHIPDCLADPDYTLLDVQRVGHFRTLLGVPLLRNGVAIGAIGLAHNVVRPFTDKQIKLVETFADQSLIAIENTRLFEEVQARTRELHRSVQELQALAEVGRAISATLDFRVVLKTIVDRSVELAGCDAGSIFYYRAETGTFELGETTAFDEEVIARFRKRDIISRGTGLDEAIAKRRPLQLPDLIKRPSNSLRDAALEAGLRAALVVPLIGTEGPLGTLVLQRRVEGEFPPAIVSLMQSFADQSVIALRNARLFEEIARQSHELELASQHKSQFLANTSHELRTPLNAILGYTELIVDEIYGKVPDNIREVLERVQSNGQHLLGLINDVLDLSKIEAGQLALSLSEYSMKEVVQTVVSGTEAMASEKNLTLRTMIADDLPRGEGDERRITQVLLNLIGNAIKFTETGGITVEVAADDGAFQVAVADTGPGIAPEDQQVVFEEFRQLDSSSTRTKGGTGLGLAISKRIVELHGGRIWVESVPGQGSCFRFTLPVRASMRSVTQ